MRGVKPPATHVLDPEHAPLTDSDRRLRRLAYDLHDGPLQELVALAEDLRLAAGQIDGVVPDADRARVRGRFQDIEARLVALEESLREIAHGGRVASSVQGPLEGMVRAELTVLEEIGVDPGRVEMYNMSSAMGPQFAEPCARDRLFPPGHLHGDMKRSRSPGAS